jgi:hypothetical protein
VDLSKIGRWFAGKVQECGERIEVPDRLFESWFGALLHAKGPIACEVRDHHSIAYVDATPELRMFAADCIARVLEPTAERYPQVLQSIEAVRQFAKGEIDIDKLQTIAFSLNTRSGDNRLTKAASAIKVADSTPEVYAFVASTQPMLLSNIAPRCHGVTDVLGEELTWQKARLDYWMSQAFARTRRGEN